MSSLTASKKVFMGSFSVVGRLVHVCLGADHLTFEEGGGGWVILKKKFLQALAGRKKMHATQRGALQNPSKTATILDNLQASEPLWLAY